jgi:protein-L-isoaspartate(D-aspartate) O-methyltransferase
MPYVDFIEDIHKKTKRDYLSRVLDFPKAEAAKKAKKFDYDYWDGDRKFGYGGYKYDGRWNVFAKRLIKHYKIKPKDKILDVGCGKGFLLYELIKEIPNLTIKGIDISKYALENAKKEVKPFLQWGNANDLPFDKNEFDLVLSINTIHNLLCPDLEKALKELERVGKNKYIVIDAYRNDNEKTNLLYWQLTCECFFTPEEWQWWFNLCSYTGDYSFIFYE